MTQTVELAQGLTLIADSSVSLSTIQQLASLAVELRHREIHGYLAAEPLDVNDPNIAYENRRVKCASCGALMPHAPWPINSRSLIHRPRCGKCGSALTCPVDGLG